jgi:plastocyanin
MRWIAATLGAVLVALATFVGLSAIEDTARADDDRVLGPGLVTVDVDIRYSKFGFDTLRVRPGTTVRFVVDNRDPIGHEFVVGDAAVHRRHEQGNERAHPPVPGEVSVGPFERGVTFSRFDAPGRYEFACHLRGHVAFGMRGWVIVTDA